MSIIHIDYLWVDGFNTPAIRSKTKVTTLKSLEDGGAELKIEPWNFDGSSTGQAPTSDSERMLVPARLYRMSETRYLLLCEVKNPDGTDHESNYRAILRNYLEENPSKDMWVGFEQEYFLTDSNRNIFWPETSGEPIKDSRYYCAVGGDRIAKRALVRLHADVCHNMGIQIVGYNAEVAPGQWEYQCFSESALRACDDLWTSRYVMTLLAEAEGLGIDWEPKPHDGWNGSGCHTNFSTEEMRSGAGGEDLFTSILEKMDENHLASMECYGEGNKSRLVGAYETAHWSRFSHGVADRGASVRIPNQTVADNWAGYLEDRRPSSNCDPYRVVDQLTKFV